MVSVSHLFSAACVSASLVAPSAGAGAHRTTKLLPPPLKNTDYRILEGPRMCGSTRSHGDAYISQAYASMLMESAGYLPVVFPNGERLVQTTLLTGTTPCHTDCLDNEDGIMEKVSDGTPVAFVALNTNANAYFSQGDEHIPIVEGQLIQFDGSVAHNTVVEAGIVKLLGPFALPSFELVGPTAAPQMKPVEAPTIDCEALSAEQCCQEDIDGDQCELCPEDNVERLSDYLGRNLDSDTSKGSKSKGSNGDSCSFVCKTKENDGGTGFCSSCNGRKNFYPFITGQLEDVATFPKRLAAIVNDLGGNLDGMFAEHEDLLPRNECSTLRNYADSALDEATQSQKESDGEDAETTTLQDFEFEETEDINEDFRFVLNPSKLGSLIGLDSIQNMYNAFKDYASDFPVSRVVIRRTSLSAYEKHIQYHNDGDTAVMHVWLNEDGVDGGNLVYLNKDGATRVISQPGSAVLHGNKIVHGITPMNGTRYILILLGDSREHEDVLEGMLATGTVADSAKASVA